MTLGEKVKLIIAMMAKGHSLISATNEANGPRAEELYIEYCSSKNTTIYDIFIGTYHVSQYFGSNPSMYKKFGWKGHNGIDFACPSGTNLISCCNGKVIQAYNDAKGWGNHIYIYDESQMVIFLYAHLKEIKVKVGQRISVGKLIGLSGNTGNSTGAHLHLGIYKTNTHGYKIDLGNGYGGAINPFDKKQVTWIIKNPSQAL